MQQWVQCPYCGTQYQNNKPFCQKCQKWTQYNCPSCNSLIDASLSSCPHCYHNLPQLYSLATEQRSSQYSAYIGQYNADASQCESAIVDKSNYSEGKERKYSKSNTGLIITVVLMSVSIVILIIAVILIPY